MTGAGRCITTALLLVTILNASAAAAPLAVSVEGPGELSPADTVAAAFQVTGILESLDHTLPGQTVPASIVIEIDLWRRKSTWWDKLVSSYTIEYRMYHDPLTREYVLLGLGQTRTFSDDKQLSAFLSEPRQAILGLAENFSLDKTYYVTVHVLVEPFNPSDLDRVDAWLKGDVTQGRGGGILGIPKALSGILMDFSGLGDHSAMGRSEPFVPNPK